MIKDTVNGAAAGAWMTSPWWLPALKAVSEVAALILPILGAVWLVVQIVTRLRESFGVEKTSG